jgi:hypothetical protein
MIILSDGNAEACNSQASTGNDCNGHADEILADNCPTITAANGTISNATPCASPYTGQPLNGTTTTVVLNKKNVTIQPAGYLSPAYPSALGECGQAVQAAQLATAATPPTTVYTVAMGAETSGGCATDQSYTITGLTKGAVAWPTGSSYPKQPCNAIGAMASNANTFYSDDTNGCAATNNAAFTTMTSIFTAIGNGLTAARLIPNGT